MPYISIVTPSLEAGPFIFLTSLLAFSFPIFSCYYKQEKYFSGLRMPILGFVSSNIGLEQRALKVLLGTLLPSWSQLYCSVFASWWHENRKWNFQADIPFQMQRNAVLICEEWLLLFGSAFSWPHDSYDSYDAHDDLKLGVQVCIPARWRGSYYYLWGAAATPRCSRLALSRVPGYPSPLLII